MSEWRKTTLGAFISLQRGHDLPARDRRPGEVPVVGSGGITGWHDESVVPGPGITIGRAANLGVPTFIDVDFWPLNTTLYVTDFRGNDVRFTYYLLSILDFSGFNSGSVQPMLNRNYIRDFPIKVPNPSEQRRIADVLGALDDKIAANEQLVQGCDDLRTLRFKEFVLENPKDVAKVPLSATADFVNGQAFTKNATGTGRMVVRIAELNSGPGASTVYNDIEVAERHIAYPGDVLFAWSGSLALARWCREKAVINQHIFKVIPREGTPAWLAFELVAQKLDEFRAIAAGKATTMGHIQRRHLDELVQVPKRAVMHNLDASLRPLWDRALAAEMESLRLEQLRDALLPGLMSGQIGVREVEGHAEDAT